MLYQNNFSISVNLASDSKIVESYNTHYQLLKLNSLIRFKACRIKRLQERGKE